MIYLIWDNAFKRKLRKYLKKHPEYKSLIKEKLDLFCREPFSVELRNHKLSGKLKKFRAIVIEYDCRIIFKMMDDDTSALLISIGTHDEVY